MSCCVVCTQLATVFCTQDKAFLCSSCDCSIHSANVLARRHHRLPVCELCKRAAATVYCHEDAAALCSVCDAEVHSANPLPHQTVPIDTALAQGLAKVTELPVDGGSAAPGSASARGGQQQPPVRHHAPAAGPCTRHHQPSLVKEEAVAIMSSPPQEQPAEDEVSACGEHSGPAVPPPMACQACARDGKRQTDGGASALHSPSEGNTSLAVVPDMGGQAGASAFPTMGLPTQDALNAKAPWAKDFDALDFEAAWFGNLDGGFDLSDLLGNDAAGLVDDAPGMVPSFPMASIHQLGSAPLSTAAAGAQLVPSALPTAPAQSVGLALGDSLPPMTSKHLSAQAQGLASEGEHLPSMLLDDDFVVPSFLPDEDDAMAALATSTRQLQAGKLDRPQQAELEHAMSCARAHDEGVSSKHGARVKRGAGAGAEELHWQSGRAGALPKLEEAAPPLARRSAAVPPPPTLLSGAALLALNGANLTREQRVARYREKRKNRKFHKTIRYASRKAYAEVRPRIKGRFATKEEVEAWKAKKAAGEAIAPEDELIF